MKSTESCPHAAKNSSSQSFEVTKQSESSLAALKAKHSPTAGAPTRRPCFFAKLVVTVGHAAQASAAVRFACPA